MTAFKRGLCYFLYGLIKKRTTSEQHSVREQLKASIGETTNALCPPHPRPWSPPCGGWPSVSRGAVHFREQVAHCKWGTLEAHPFALGGGGIFATDSLKSYPLPFLNA